MTSNYEFAFDEVCDQLKAYSPSVVPILDRLKRAASAQVAYYAGFILVCLKAQQGTSHHKPLAQLMKTDLQDFTFFEAVKDNPLASALFDELLQTYVREQNTQ